MQKVTPFFWFDTQADEAVDFYVSVFKDSRKGRVNYYPDGIPGVGGKVMSVGFQLFGQEFIALNGGPQYKFTPAISMLVHCKGQQEVDEYWEKLTAGGGTPGRCGWLEDKFGVTWQVVPEELQALLSDPKKAAKIMPGMLTMGKIDIGELERAGAGG
jgi:predicted 3-demethylubiquinone-9 3-methyltransferase (glyoxalase superfamily)